MHRNNIIACTGNHSAPCEESLHLLPHFVLQLCYKSKALCFSVLLRSWPICRPRENVGATCISVPHEDHSVYLGPCSCTGKQNENLTNLFFTIPGRKYPEASVQALRAVACKLKALVRCDSFSGLVNFE